MDDVKRREAERAERLEASLTAISTNYRPDAPSAPQRASSSIGAGYVPSAREMRLGWGAVFDLAFKFTVALAVINIPIVVILYLVLRSAD